MNRRRKTTRREREKKERKIFKILSSAGFLNSKFEGL